MTVNDVGLDDWVIGAKAFMRRTGLTYRQVDYWTRQGVLVPLVNGRGSGSRREFDEREIDVAIALRRLTEATAPLPRHTMAGVAAVIRDTPEVHWVRLAPAGPGPLYAAVPEPTRDGAVYLAVLPEGEE